MLQVDPHHDVYTRHGGNLEFCLPCMLHGDEGVGHRRKPVMQLLWGPLLRAGLGAIHRLFLITTCPHKYYSKFNMGAAAGNPVLDRLMLECGRSASRSYYTGIETEYGRFFLVFLGLAGDHPFQVKVCHSLRGHLRVEVCPWCHASTRQRCSFWRFWSTCGLAQDHFPISSLEPRHAATHVSGAWRWPPWILEVGSFAYDHTWLCSKFLCQHYLYALWSHGAVQSWAWPWKEEGAMPRCCICSVWQLVGLHWPKRSRLERIYPWESAMDQQQRFPRFELQSCWHYVVDQVASGPTWHNALASPGALGACLWRPATPGCIPAAVLYTWGSAFFGPVQQQDGCEHLLKFLFAFEALAIYWFNRNWCLFGYTPKCHYTAHWHEELWDALRQSKRWTWNPAAFATPMMEDFVGICSRMSRSTHAGSVPIGTIRKYLVHALQMWEWEKKSWCGLVMGGKPFQCTINIFRWYICCGIMWNS